MSARAQLLIVNPGSTSTRVALFQETELITSITITHPTSEIQQLTGIDAQYQYRLRQIEAFLKQTGMPLLAAVVGRGGLLSPVPSGTYLVDDKMLYDLQQGVYGQHASNLGGILARGLADPRQIPAYVVDPVSVDEFVPEARLSGLPQVARRSLGHALNMRAVAQYLANKQGRLLAEVNYIVAHLGGGISIAPIAGGRILDCNDANQAGPFSAERAGSLPAGEIIRLSYSGKYTLAQLQNLLHRQAGLAGYLGSNDARLAVQQAEQGDSRAILVLEAMAYQIAKEIGAMATVVAGEIDAIILTGGLAYATYLTARISNYVDYIAPVQIVPGEREMLALAAGAWRVLSGQEQAVIYAQVRRNRDDN